MSKRCLLLAVIVLVAVSALAQTHRTMVLTFDDLPKAGAQLKDADDLVAAQRITSDILSVLKAHHAPAIGFVNERRLFVTGQTDARIAVLQAWVDAGMELGNHTFSHWDLNSVSLKEYEDDVIHGEVVWRRLMEQSAKKNTATNEARPSYPLYFRHPFTHSGDTKEKKDAFEAFLASRGYVIAPFTVEHFDYGFNAIYLKALSRGDQEQASRIRQAYIYHLGVALDFFERKSRDLFGREIPQILLIHASDINAVSLDDMLTKLEKRGYSIVTLGQALSDPAYATKDDYVGRFGPSWLHRWTVALGKPMDLRSEPDPPGWVLDLYKGLQ